MNPQTSIDHLLAIMAKLRDPEEGCPWDREQSFATIAPYTLEEAYEVSDAIARDAMGELRDELGDLLFQVVFHAQMASEQGHFDFQDVVAAIVDKMIRRHPHVFAGEQVGDADAQTEAWEVQKQRERSAITGAIGASRLDGVTLGLPALVRAQKLQQRAARAGLELAGQALLDAAYTRLNSPSADTRSPEVRCGELLFACVAYARTQGVDAESALRQANRDFERRFKAFEQAQGAAFERQDQPQLQAAWRAYAE